MSKYRLICPECGAVVITTSPEAVVWELCPGCRSHMWDVYDVMMAEVTIQEFVDSKRLNAALRPHSN